MRGNVVGMAVGITIGAAFGSIVKSLVSDVLVPPIGLLSASVDLTNLFVVIKQETAAGPFAALAEAQQAGAVRIDCFLVVVAFLLNAEVVCQPEPMSSLPHAPASGVRHVVRGRVPSLT